ncbi:MAG: hypothetical protein JSR17_09520, partial [Proteobacteria bacterium]|nr:hypothetical protein [Pseudomonadota bacterium]
MFRVDVSIKKTASWFLGLDLYLNLSSIPEPFFKTVTETIRFKNEDEFQTKLNNFLKRYKQNHFGFIPYQYSLNFNVKGGAIPLVKERAKTLLHYYPFLTEVKISGNQAAYVNEIANLERKRAAKRSRNRALFGGLFGGLFSLGYFSLSSFPMVLALSIAIVLGAALITSLASHFRELYLSYAHFPIQDTYPERVIDFWGWGNKHHAYESGKDASKWPGYFLSFFEYRAYQHPLTYAAGLKRKQDYDYTIIDISTNYNVDFKQIDPRIENYGWLHTSPMRTSIAVPTVYLDEILPKLSK